MLRFSIKLNIREKELIKGLVSFFKNWEINSKVSNSSLITHREASYKNININIVESSVGLQITKISDIVNILIPFFERYPIAGFKSLDFSDFKKMAFMIKNKEHFSCLCGTSIGTEEGFKKILKIKSSMNQNRITNFCSCAKARAPIKRIRCNYLIA
jgi:LAGLIDADG endonuclease